MRPRGVADQVLMEWPHDGREYRTPRKHCAHLQCETLLIVLKTAILVFALYSL
jgi:hypothetical protein